MIHHFVRKFQTLTIAIRFAATLAIFGILSTQAMAQNPVPFVSQPLVPDAVAPGGAGFTLTVNGTGFVSASVVNWNGSPRATTYVSSSQLTAKVLASDIASASSAAVTVASPTPGGGASNTIFFPINQPTASVGFNTSDYTVGDNPLYVVTADFNGDGKQDLAVGNFQSSSVSVLLGNGNGTFQNAVGYSVGTEPQSTTFGDFGNNGKIDLAVTYELEPSQIAVFQGNGDGTFQPAVSYAVGRGATYTLTADVNGDGNLDLLIVNQYDSTVSVLFGNGDGTFRPQAAYSVGGSTPTGAAVGDFNGDGKLDIAVSNWGSNTVSVLLGNGDGSFQPATSYPAGSNPGGVNIADVNGDGILDLLVPNQGSSNVSVLLGKGDGTFAPQVEYSVSGGAIRAEVGDFNQDGKLDLVVVTYANTLDLLLGNGDGTFQPALSFPTETYPWNVAVADFNQDGHLDAVVPGATGASTIAVMLQTPSVQTTPTTTTIVSSLNPSSFGQNVTFTATVSASSGMPTGTVIFYDSSTSIGSVTLTSGTASLSTSSLAAGSHSITATYQGSGSFAPSTSPVLTQVVNGATIATTTTIATSKNPGIYQQPVTFTATVTSASGTPTGTVVFFEDTKHAMGSATLVNGVASFTISSLKRDKYAITAAYLGSGNFLPSTSPALEEWINYSGLFQTHTVERSSGSPSLVGQAVTFTAYVRSRYGEIPDGDLVVFATGEGLLLGTGTTQNGAASITTSSLRAGQLTIFAYYEGDDDFHTSFTHQIQTVDKDPTTTTVTASPNPAVYGQAVTYTATVTSQYGTPTGTVRISDIGLVPLVNGVATITKDLVRAGTHDITAAYQSDSDFARSTSAVYKEVVTPASTTTVLTSSANPSSSGQTVTFTATVTSSAGVNPFGTVTFTAGGTTLGTAALKDGAASVSTASLPVGSTTITATYSGADSFTGSSASLTQVVQ